MSDCTDPNREGDGNRWIDGKDAFNVLCFAAEDLEMAVASGDEELARLALGVVHDAIGIIDVVVTKPMRSRHGFTFDLGLAPAHPLPEPQDRLWTDEPFGGES